MANWNKENSVITTSGINILAKAQIGEGTIVITRIVSRDVVSTAEENKNYTAEDIAESSIKQTGILISSTSTKEGVSIITARFSNERLEEDYSYTIRQVIVMAKLVTANNIELVSESPYLVLQSDEGDFLPPKKDTPTSYDYKIHVVHTNVPEITVNIQTSGFVSDEVFEEFKSETDSRFISNERSIEKIAEKIAEESVGQHTHGKSFSPWMPEYDEVERVWSKVKSNLEKDPVAKDNSERFNHTNSVSDDTVDSNGISVGNLSLGSHSHAEGLDNVTFGQNSHVEGANNYIGFALDDTKGNLQHCGFNSHVEGFCNTAVYEDHQHVEGYTNFSNGFSNHTEGAHNLNKGETCHVEGNYNSVTGSKSKFNSITGDHNTCRETQRSHMSGGNNTLDDSYNTLVTGSLNNVSTVHNSIVSGEDNRINTTDYASVSGNHNITLDSSYLSICGSQNTVSEGNHVFMQGTGLRSTGGANCSIFGKFNVDDSENRYMMIVGNGTSKSSRRNIFTLDTNGNIYNSGSISSQSADLAEYFEWCDGNTENQDRAGLFVTLNEDKIELAKYSDDYVFGCVSACPAIIANNPQEWNSKYKTDVFGRVLYEESKIEETEEDGTTSHKVIVSPVLNPDYVPDSNYIPRSSRPEWACVACTGRVVAVDDGSCEPNGYCRPHKKGVATKSDSGFRVLKRIDENHILVWIEHSVKF